MSAERSIEMAEEGLRADKPACASKHTSMRLAQILVAGHGSGRAGKYHSSDGSAVRPARALPS